MIRDLRIKKFCKMLVDVFNYEVWKVVVLEFDFFEGNVEWKEDFVFDFYYYELIYDCFSNLK